MSHYCHHYQHSWIAVYLQIKITRKIPVLNAFKLEIDYRYQIEWYIAKKNSSKEKFNLIRSTICNNP